MLDVITTVVLLSSQLAKFMCCRGLKERRAVFFLEGEKKESKAFLVGFPWFRRVGGGLHLHILKNNY